MRVLAIDTALGACSACIAESGAADVIARETILMERGHAEALVPLLDRVTARLAGGFSALDRVAVAVGPGSYTGLRVGIAAARAIGLAADVPVVGVTTLSALLATLVADDNRRLLAAAIAARHGQVYFQAISPAGQSVVAPSLISTREAARALGAGHSRILALHVLRNAWTPIIVLVTQQTALMIILESSLSFLGVGAPVGTPSWGTMVADGRDYVMTNAWWLTAFPGLAISLTVLAINFFGDGLRDVLDPRLRL